jgi:hypothetical protein
MWSQEHRIARQAAPRRAALSAAFRSDPHFSMISFRALPEHAFGQRFVTNSEQRPARLLANKNVMRADWHSNQPHVMGRLNLPPEYTAPDD